MILMMLNFKVNETKNRFMPQNVMFGLLKGGISFAVPLSLFSMKYCFCYVISFIQVLFGTLEGVCFMIVTFMYFYVFYLHGVA